MQVFYLHINQQGMSTILQIANSDRNLTSMMKGLKAANLEETLNGIGPFTILAPVNLAFSNLNPTSYEELLLVKNNIKLSDILSFHVLTGKKMLKDFINGQKLKTISGKEVDISIKDGEVHINGAKILSKDRQASNGVVHSINAVNTPS
jgi:uncharacterized surface protein with fasciclin (FAS1) repeats